MHFLYADLLRFNIDEVSPWYGEAEEFVEFIEKIVKNEIGSN